MSSPDKWLQNAAETIFRAVGEYAREEIRTGRVGLVELVQQVQQFTDRIVREAVEEGPDTHRPVCCEGCSACCYLHVVASPMEILAIATLIRMEWPTERIGELKSRIRKHIAATERMDASTRRQVRIPCPLLTSGRCDVYSMRPLSCRGWNSLDRSTCEADLASPTENKATPVNIRQYVLAQRISEGLAASSHSQSLECQPLDFVRGLQIALDDPSAVTTAWRNGSDVFADARNERVFPGPRDPELDAARNRLWNSL